MVQSMTGFGAAAYDDAGWRVKAEVRSVNHRYCDISMRLPKGYLALEEKIRALCGEFVARGRVEISLAVEESGGRARTVKLDRALLTEYERGLDEAAAIAGCDVKLDAPTLAQLPGALVIEESQTDPDAAWPVIADVLREAFSKLRAMRIAEGTRLKQDVEAKLDAFAAALEQIHERGPEATERFRLRLREQIGQLLGDLPVDEQRVAQEVAHFAEKSNYDEEVTRAQSHILQIRQTCAAGGSAGRKLDFLIQELNREINTIGAKAQDAVVATLVVDAKSLLEKMREQVQNIQ